MDATAGNRQAIADLFEKSGLKHNAKRLLRKTPLGGSFDQGMEFPKLEAQDFSAHKVPTGNPSAWLSMFNQPTMEQQPQDEPHQLTAGQMMYGDPMMYDQPAMQTPPPAEGTPRPPLDVQSLWGFMGDQPAMMTPPPTEPPSAAEIALSNSAVPHAQGGTINPLDKYNKQIEAKSLEGIAAQKASAAELLKYKQALLGSHESQMDLSPLMALSDSWTGSKMAGGYAKPESSMERLNKVMGVEKEIGSAQGRITDDEIALLRNKANAELMKQKLTLQYGGGDPMGDLSNEGRKMVSLANEGMNAITGMEQAIASGVGPTHIDANTPLIGNFKSDNAFTSNQRIGAEMFGRLQSGGAINKDEEKRFIALGPRPGDKPEIAREKLAAQKAALEDKMRIFGVQPHHLAQIGVTRRGSVPSEGYDNAGGAVGPRGAGGSTYKKTDIENEMRRRGILK